MKYIRVLVMILGVSLVSCNFSNEIKFPKEEIITPELMPLQGITVPYRIEIKSPFLILQNKPTMKDSLFHVYNIADNKLKCVFGTIGQGPAEFSLPTMIQSYLPDIIIEDNNSFYKFDLNDEGLVTLKEKVQPQYVNDVIQASFINDSMFVVDAKYVGPNVDLCSINDEMPKKQWKYRDTNIMDYYRDLNKGHVYANKERIIFCYEMKKQIDFMDTKFNLIKSVKFDDYNVPDGIGNIPDEERNSYIYAYLGQRYLYAMFLGTTWGEHKERKSCGYHLEVFDLDGNPICRYQLQGSRPTNYAVDENTFTLYGSAYKNNPEDHLLVYKLKGLE